jgi:hypothetical protein
MEDHFRTRAAPLLWAVATAGVVLEGGAIVFWLLLSVPAG